MFCSYQSQASVAVACAQGDQVLSYQLYMQEILAECGSQHTTVAETLRAESARARAGRPQPSFSVEQKGIA